MDLKLSNSVVSSEKRVENRNRIDPYLNQIRPGLKPFTNRGRGFHFVCLVSHEESIQVKSIGPPAFPNGGRDSPMPFLKRQVHPPTYIIFKVARKILGYI